MTTAPVPTTPAPAAPARRGLARALGGLAARLFLAQLLVALVAAATLWLVAAAVGPAIFRRHLREAMGQVDPQMNQHVEQAYRSASAVSVTVALVGSLLAALAVSGYVTRRIAGPAVRLASAAQQLARGRYDTRVTSPAIGAEFATLTDSFNAMAARLETVESTRRRLLADLGHEMRTPIATLDGYLEGLEDGVLAATPETLAVLRTQTARLTRLAEDLSAVSRAEEHQLELHPEPIEAAELVAAAIDAAREGYAEKGVTLSAGTGGEAVPAVRVDRDRIGQVLGNLLDNALRHVPAGGHVTVTAAAAGADRPTATISVVDDGDGIPAEHLPHVFERFYRVDRARDRRHGGSGIGLAIVKAVVEAHGGGVTATSAGPGRGTTITLSLPAA
jgi:signal transduction histidine kinase